MIKPCVVDDLERAIAAGEAQVLDVREAAEFESEHIEGSLHFSVTELDEKTASRLDRSKPVFVICHSGKRAARAAELLNRFGFHDARLVEGGLRAWIAAGKSVVRGTHPVWDLERQVRFAAGALVLLGLLLARFWHPYFILLSAFVGAGLVFSAVTNTCGLAYFLARMPWNQLKSADGEGRACCCLPEKEEKRTQ